MGVDQPLGKLTRGLNCDIFSQMNSEGVCRPHLERKLPSKQTAEEIWKMTLSDSATAQTLIFHELSVHQNSGTRPTTTLPSRNLRTAN